MRSIIAVGVAILAISEAHATNTAEVPQEAVNIGDLRQDTPEGLARIYRRLHAAAERVCSPLAGVDKFDLQQKKCVREAVDRAAGQIPALAQYDARRRKIKPG